MIYLLMQTSSDVASAAIGGDWISVIFKNYGPASLPIVGILLFWKLIFQPMIDMVRTDSKANAIVADTNKEAATVLSHTVTELKDAIRELRHIRENANT